jgi:acyl-CoA synthetase (AMP-forming)/AMP-acid ligase II
MFVDNVRNAAPGLPIVVLGEAAGAEPLTALLGGSTTPPAIEISPDALAVMPYSSGTTGFPKGVMLTQRNMIAQCLAIEAKTDSPIVVPDATMLAVLPFFHIYGIMVFLTYGLVQGATTVTMPRFDLEQFLQLARRYEIPQLHVVPPILLALAKYPGELQLPKVRLALVGAAPLSGELAAEFTRRTGAVVYQAYGMTEVAGATHLGSVTPGRNKPGSIGDLIGNAKTVVVSTDTGEEVGPGERGELWVRGPFVMAGYFEDPAATAATIDAAGWLHTGDVGSLRDGRLFMASRRSDLILRGGENVYPAEIEAVLDEHPQVIECTVHGVPDDDLGQAVAAVVVCEGVGADELRAFAAERLAYYKVPAQWQLTNEPLPRTATGKVIRRA